MANEEVVVKLDGPEVHLMEPKIKVQTAIGEKAQQFMNLYYHYLKERTDAYVHRMTELKPEAGEPVTFLGYQYWNVLTVGPIQFFTDPPWRPSKIIAAGELTLLLGVIWINPGPDPGGGVPGTVVLGGRGYRVRMETVNLSTVQDGPDANFVGNFAAVPPVINFFPWFFVPPDPGVNPRLFETTLTADVTDVAQPFAAFSTWHWDLDFDPPFLGRPPRGPEWQYDIPARYLVYRR